ncbi:hypothetical protein F511_46283 [Dorcoceras hygrometricum]|uniref:Uncharacterized protein n=1 Tax=Dorcoceras hygrometricum TaxID=472368 RepID=A0A2Z6ZTZ6_9LAMI|nr:hypothetical protein F511_46283 [Dorcoceras hygrometricum]
MTSSALIHLLNLHTTSLHLSRFASSADSQHDVASALRFSLHLLIANAKRCRSNLFKRHRFANANSKYQLLMKLSAGCFLLNDDVTADVIQS